MSEITRITSPDGRIVIQYPYRKIAASVAEYMAYSFLMEESPLTGAEGCADTILAAFERGGWKVEELGEE